MSLPSFGSLWAPGIGYRGHLEPKIGNSSCIRVSSSVDWRLDGRLYNDHLDSSVFIASPNKHKNTIVLVVLGRANFFDWQEGAGRLASTGNARLMQSAVRRSKRTRQGSRAATVMIKGAVGVLCQSHVRRLVKRVQFVKPVQADNSTLCDFVVRGTPSKRTYSVTTHIRSYHTTRLFPAIS